jgi:hypothetical protein
LIRNWLAAGTILCAPALEAQVGSTPAQSPFRDIDHRAEATLLVGYFAAGKDPVGVSPKPAPFAAARYSHSVGALVSLGGRIGLAASKRTVIDPTRPAAQRVIGETGHMVLLVDAGAEFHPVGARTWNGLMPVVHLGLGVSTGLETRDAGGYTLPARVLIAYGVGVKWLASDDWIVRADVNDYRLGIRYPSTYFVPASDGSIVREGDNSVYTSNPTFTIGVSYRLFR